MNTVPSKKELIHPTVEALKSLGGSGTNREICDAVIEALCIPDETANFPHRDTGNQTRLEYNLAWARTCLARSGIVENVGRGVWAIVPDKSDATIDADKVYKSALQAKTKDPAYSAVEDEPSDEDDGVEAWRTELSQVLTETLSSDAFERLRIGIAVETKTVEVVTVNKDWYAKL